MPRLLSVRVPGGAGQGAAAAPVRANERKVLLISGCQGRWIKVLSASKLVTGASPYLVRTSVKYLLHPSNLLLRDCLPIGYVRLHDAK